MIMQMHNPSQFCIIEISFFFALGAHSEIANGTPKRCGSRKWPLPAACIIQKDYAKFMHNDYAKFMQMNYAKIMQKNYAKSKNTEVEKLKGRVTYTFSSWVV
jgi:hypothetical protein